MGIICWPPNIGEIAARNLYPELSGKTREAMSEEEFAVRIEELLAEAGDLYPDDKNEATDQGEAHGLFTKLCSAWEYSDDYERVAHMSVVRVWSTEKGDRYIKDLVRKHFPDLRDE